MAHRRELQLEVNTRGHRDSREKEPKSVPTATTPPNSEILKFKDREAKSVAFPRTSREIGGAGGAGMAQVKDCGINYEILRAVDKSTDTNPTLISWLYDEAKDDPFSNSPDILLHKNWVPRSRTYFF
jgi:hypothetical protein